jgi:hypothetical protein
MNVASILSRIENLKSDQDKSTASIATIKALFLSDFFLFAKHALGYKDLEWAVHGECIQALESDAKKKLVVLPRGSFKSSLGSVAYPMWKLERDPNATILLDSEIYSNSKNFLREIKGHYASSKFIKIFGNRIGPKWDEGEIIIEPRTKNRKEASITVGGIETTKVGQHYDVIIGDDYNSAQNSDTPEKCQKVIDHFKYNLNILNPGGEYLLIGTRYAELDVIGFLLSNVLEEKYLAEGKLMRGSPPTVEQEDQGLLLGV